ncbi:hypothetical protein [Paenibacillus jiagnxiensis]|uniref:hypothetical protein n=1 Tax=Paenibacillus jiagnxiensis TaxID=3228926 RepID=UPI0033A702C3
MNEEFLKAIEQLLDQKLAPIHDQLEKVDHEFASVHDKLEKMDHKLNLLVESQPEDIGAILEIINKKLDEIKTDVEFTFHKASQNELELNRLKHQ